MIGNYDLEKIKRKIRDDNLELRLHFMVDNINNEIELQEQINALIEKRNISIFCYSQICEEILPEYEENILPPDKFKPYSSRPQQQEPTLVRLTNPNNPLVQLVTNLINLEYENDEIENILNYIMSNDNNRYGSPPASQSEIKKTKSKY